MAAALHNSARGAEKEYTRLKRTSLRDFPVHDCHRQPRNARETGAETPSRPSAGGWKRLCRDRDGVSRSRRAGGWSWATTRSVFSRMIDARIHGEMQRADPRVFARPFELQRGQAVTPQAAGRPAERPRLLTPRTFGRARAVHRRAQRDRADPARRRSQGPDGPRRVRHRAARPAEAHGIERLELPPTKKTVEPDPPRRAAHHRTHHRRRARSGATCRLQVIPTKMVQAVLAIEDRRFYDHPGVDPIGIAGAVFRIVRRTRSISRAAAPSRSSSSRTPS